MAEKYEYSGMSVLEDRENIHNFRMTNSHFLGSISYTKKFYDH